VTEREEARLTLQNHVQLLQQALVPEKPTIASGYDLASVYIPAYADQSIGGDFFDVFRTEDEQIGLLIGDVSGKGIPAASLAAITRSTVRAFAYDLSSPSQALEHADAVLTKQQNSDFNQFVTVAVVIIDPNTGHIRFSGAGHPPAAIRRANGSLDWIYSAQMPIGIMGKQQFDELENDLQPGDKIILYTDGISEARHGAALFGLDGISDVLTTHGSECSEELLNSLLSAAIEWGKGHVSDDTAVIVIERRRTK
jgi:serine phosphatase RsbU (regulator of sigma subunit)